MCTFKSSFTINGNGYHYSAPRGASTLFTRSVILLYDCNLLPNGIIAATENKGVEWKRRFRVCEDFIVIKHSVVWMSV